MKLSLRAKLTGVILALAALITVAITVGSYIQMRNQLINTAIRNEVSGTAAGTSALIKEWISTRKGRSEQLPPKQNLGVRTQREEPSIRKTS